MLSSQAKETPLPLKQMFALGIVLLNESFCSTMLLPYVGLLVAHIQNRPPEEAGYFSGLLVGVFMFGQVLSGRVWGCVSDQYGRRAPLLFGLFASAIVMLGFSFSTHVWMCIVFRFLHGLFNGNVLVAKTALADILDKTNEAKGFVLVSLTFGFGTLIGPAVGGLLYDPANSAALRWAGFNKEGLFAEFPGLLPGLVVFVYTIFAILVCFMYVHETNSNAQPLPWWLISFIPWVSRNRQHVALPGDELADTSVVVLGDGRTDMEGKELELGRKKDKKCGVVVSEISQDDVTTETSTVSRKSLEMGISRSHTMLEVAGRVTPVEDGKKKGEELTTVDLVDMENLEQKEESLDAIVVRNIGMDEEEEMEKTSFGYCESFSNYGTRNVLVLYMLLCAADMAFAEVFPLWAVAGEQAGGLGYHSDLLGLVLLLNSVPCVSANIFFHVACRAVKDKMRLWRICTFALGVSVAFFPFVVYFPHGAHFTVVIVACSARQWFSAWAFAMITLLTARVAPKRFVGAMFGICQSCGAAMRCVTPVIVTPLFAWSIGENHIPPFNHMFVFIVTSIVFGIAGIASLGVLVQEDTQEEMNEPSSGIGDADQSVPKHSASVGQP